MDDGVCQVGFGDCVGSLLVFRLEMCGQSLGFHWVDEVPLGS